MARNIFRQTRFSLAALILTAAFTADIAAQTTYSVPKKLSLSAVVRRTFPQYFGRGYRFPQLITEGFFPIGWSRDGKFAYYTEPVDEACGCYYANLVIQDLRTDKVIWEFKYNQDDGRDNETNKMPPEDNIQKLWRKNQKLFSEKLAASGIQASNFVLLGKAFTSEGRTFTAKAAITTGKNPDGDDLRVNKINLMLSSPNLGSKQVDSADYSKEEYWFMLGAGVVGVLKSPFENRVALVMIEVMRGYEGPPNSGDIRIVGADLDRGFIKGR